MILASVIEEKGWGGKGICGPSVLWLFVSVSRLKRILPLFPILLSALLTGSVAWQAAAANKWSGNSVAGCSQNKSPYGWIGCLSTFSTAWLPIIAQAGPLRPINVETGSLGLCFWSIATVNKPFNLCGKKNECHSLLVKDFSGRKMTPAVLVLYKIYHTRLFTVWTAGLLWQDDWFSRWCNLAVVHLGLTLLPFFSANVSSLPVSFSLQFSFFYYLHLLWLFYSCIHLPPLIFCPVGSYRTREPILAWYWPNSQLTNGLISHRYGRL